MLPQVVNEDCGLRPVPPQPGEILDDDGFDLLLLHRLIDLVDARTVEVHAADVVVEGLSHHLVAVGHGIAIDDLPLIGQGIQFVVLIPGQAIRPSDSPLFREIMQTYTDEPFAKDYKQAPTEFCRQKLRLLVKPRLAVRYLTALDRRDLLWILVPEEALQEVKQYAE